MSDSSKSAGVPSWKWVFIIFCISMSIQYWIQCNYVGPDGAIQGDGFKFIFEVRLALFIISVVSFGLLYLSLMALVGTYLAKEYSIQFGKTAGPMFLVKEVREKLQKMGRLKDE